ncbi:MAG TPA: 50S ribosomal protein L33 [Patescibacteria group bacterium]
MAYKGKSTYVRLACSVCKSQNYTTTKTRETQEKLALKKFCKFCRKTQPHVELKISTK